MELWKASMIPIIEDSFGPNGLEVTDIFDLNPRTLSSSTTGIIVTASSRGKPLYSSSKRRAISLFSHRQSSVCQGLPTSQRELSRLFALSEVIESWISSESILSSLRPLSILMFELKSLPLCIKFKSTLAMIWLLLFPIVYRLGSLQISKMGNLCIDTC